MWRRRSLPTPMWRRRSLPTTSGLRRWSSTLPLGLTHLWSTPVSLSRLTTSDSFDHQLTQAAVRAHHHATKRVRDLGLEQADVLADENSKFYHWQAEEHDLPSDSRSPPYNQLVGSSEHAELRGHIERAVQEYADACGLEYDADEVELVLWAAVLRSGETHLAHVHPSSIVSGVYYSHAPPGAGVLLLDDPRGPLPPFMSKMPIAPQTGNLVLWPSWLQHQVVPASYEGARVSWSFNLQQASELQSTAAWDVSSMVHAHVPSL